MRVINYKKVSEETIINRILNTAYIKGNKLGRSGLIVYNKNELKEQLDKIYDVDDNYTSLFEKWIKYIQNDDYFLDEFEIIIDELNKLYDPYDEEEFEDYKKIYDKAFNNFVKGMLDGIKSSFRLDVKKVIREYVRQWTRKNF